MKRLCGYSIVFALLFYCPTKAWAQSDKSFLTQYTTVYYSQDSDLDEFLWKLGGQRLEFTQNRELARNRIDRLVNRVNLILDMWPKNFRIFIHIERGALEANRAAYYDEGAKTIHISVDYASDGVLAHEIAHAVINQNFSLPAPTKMKEILCQYVDAHLWSDY
ncbi:MAG: hypothetical protein A3K83_04650 [Omnitrophica WOR_2 bacterium RBG_13_44_8b]|nr:MAG: hypothetical protein A3K83_04650 [Omnitrophica WOR_2 bacterium RBG_13_44_8b]